MAELKWDQATLVQKTDAVSQSRLSKYLVRGELPKSGTLDELCKQFPDRLREGLIAAYLTDQIPPSGRGLVMVSAVKEGEPGDRKYVPDKFPPGSITREDIDYIERRALEDPNVAKMLNFWAASLRGIKPNPVYFEDDEDEGGSVKDDPRVVAAKKRLEERNTENRSGPKKTRYTKGKSDEPT